MKKILAFAGSNHKASVNYKMLDYTATLLADVEVNVLDIRDWVIPIYSIDMDPDQTPDRITELIALIEQHDAYIIASPEHNGSTPAFFKNILDWLSRRTNNVFDGKPMLLMSTSPGAKGGASNLQYLIGALPYQGAQIRSSFSLPSFYDNMKDGKLSGELLDGLKRELANFTTGI